MVCGRISVRSIGPPFHVDVLLILILTPCFSAAARSGRAMKSRSQCKATVSYVLAGFMKLLPSVNQEDATSPCTTVLNATSRVNRCWTTYMEITLRDTRVRRQLDKCVTCAHKYRSGMIQPRRSSSICQNQRQFWLLGSSSATRGVSRTYE